MKTAVILLSLFLSACAVKQDVTPKVQYVTQKCINGSKPEAPISQHDKLNAKTDPSILYAAALSDYIDYKAYSTKLELSTVGCW